MDLTNCWQQHTVTQTRGLPTDPVPTAANVATIKALECVFMGILNVVLRFGGIVLFIMIVLGGFAYLTAGGDPKKAQLGRNVFTYAVVGLGLLIMAWFFLLFVENFTEVEVTVFNLTM